jgi:hypothetical protein
MPCCCLSVIWHAGRPRASRHRSATISPQPSPDLRIEHPGQRSLRDWGCISGCFLAGIVESCAILRGLPASGVPAVPSPAPRCEIGLHMQKQETSDLSAHGRCLVLAAGARRRYDRPRLESLTGSRLAHVYSLRIVRRSDHNRASSTSGAVHATSQARTRTYVPCRKPRTRSLVRNWRRRSKALQTVVVDGALP